MPGVARIQRTNSLMEAMIAAQAGQEAGIWTALPGIVQSFDPVKMTVVVLPAVQCQFQDQSGAWVWVTLPLLGDVPIVFPNGGGFTMTFPIKPNDEVLVIFSSRCIDQWWKSGGVQIQPELRMHSLSDGFALPGPRSQPRVLESISTQSVQLRADDGETFIELDESQTVTIRAPGGVNISTDASVNLMATSNVNVTADKVNIDAANGLKVTGKVDIIGNITTTGTLLNNGVNVGSTHVHSGVTPGGSNSGPPV